MTDKEEAAPARAAGDRGVHQAVIRADTAPVEERSDLLHHATRIVADGVAFDVVKSAAVAAYSKVTSVDGTHKSGGDVGGDHKAD